jgi:hypothetical protein
MSKRTHDQTLRAIFAQPTQAKIVWSSIESLLKRRGAEIEGGKAQE